MEDQKRMLIIVAGALAVGGGGVWFMLNQANQKPEEQANSPAPKPIATNTAPAGTPGAAPAGTPGAAPAGTPGAAPAGTPGAAPAGTPGAAPAGAPVTSSAGGAPSTTPAAPKGNLTGLAGMSADDPSGGTPANTTPLSAAPTTIASATTPSNLPISAAPTSSASSKYPATKRDEAASAAKQVAGREDPMMGTFERTPYPAPWTKAGAGAHGSSGGGGSASEGDVANVPPPPPAMKEPPAPPPPPSQEANNAPQLPIDNLPQPPDKPLVTPSLKLTAIVGNKAVLSVPLQLRVQNKWPAVICLGPGERFEDPTNGSFSVVSVDPDSVTIEEESERSVKSLPQIK